MRKIISYLLVLSLIFVSFSSFAAKGDYIHTGLKRAYNMSSEADKEALRQDLKTQDINKFYREVDGGQYVNIVEEQRAEEEALIQILQNSSVDLSNPYKIQEFLANPGNLDQVADAINGAVDDISKDFDDIGDGGKGNIEDYFKDKYAPSLKLNENYSIPVPGFKENSTKIVSLMLPTGLNASGWMVKTGTSPFGPFDKDQVLNGPVIYRSNTDIDVASNEKYLLLAAIGSGNKVKAYVNIDLTKSMIKPPKVPSIKDETLGLTVGPGSDYSGSVILSGLSGDWNIAILDSDPTTVYESDTFVSQVYRANMEVVVFKDDDLNSGASDKYILVYSILDGKINKYKSIKTSFSATSGLLPAMALVESTNYNVPSKGNEPGTSIISGLNGLDTFGASKWMYYVGTSIAGFYRDQKINLAFDYSDGMDIEVKLGDKILLLATDGEGRVRAYKDFNVDSEMIKNPVAEELRPNIHYNNPIRGSEVGTSKMPYLKHDEVTSWSYILSNEDIPKPELDKNISDYTSMPISLTDNESGNFNIEANELILKADNDFKKYMMIVGSLGGKIKAYRKFIMNDTNVKMPIASEFNSLPSVSKGTMPNTSMVTSLDNAGFTNVLFRYKILDRGSLSHIDFNEVIDSSLELRDSANIPTSVGKDLLILLVNKDTRKTKAFKIIQLEFNNVNAGPADSLVERTHYVGPVPGGDNGTTKFSFLNPSSGGSKLLYKVGKTSHGVIESGAYTDGSYSLVEKDMDINVVMGDFLLLVSVDNTNRVLAYREFVIQEANLKGPMAKVMDEANYTLHRGDSPGSMKVELYPLGLDNPNNIRWRYKLVDSLPGSDKDKPYVNQVVDGTAYNISTLTNMGGDIPIAKVNGGYGYILILATDSNGKTKAFAYAEIDGNFVKEYAEEMALSMDEGTSVDSVKFSLGNETYRYLISPNKPPIPAKGDSLPPGAMAYESDHDIVVEIGRYITIYKVNENERISAYASILIESVKQGKASLTAGPVSEAKIKEGGHLLSIKLSEGAEWVDNLDTTSIKRALLSGLRADIDQAQWSRVVEATILDSGSIIKNSPTSISIFLSQALSYDIAKEHTISLVVPPSAIKGALNPISASGSFLIKPSIGGNLSGTILDYTREDSINVGGKTLVIDLEDGVWVGFDDTAKIALIAGFSDGNEWVKVKNALENSLSNVVRNSGTKVTITLPPVDVNLTGVAETIYLTIPSSLVQKAEEDIIVSPSFTIYPNIIKISGQVEAPGIIYMQAPDGKNIYGTDNIWSIRVNNAVLKDGFSEKDIALTNLPSGLKFEVEKTGDRTFDIKLTGVSSSVITGVRNLSLRVKGSAVSEPGSLDSSDIILKLETKAELGFDGISWSIEEDDIYLIGIGSGDFQYSLDSTNGVNGEWTKMDSEKVHLSNKLVPLKVFLREVEQPKVLYGPFSLQYMDTPSDISISKVDYVGSHMKLTLRGLTNKMQYSTDGGYTWTGVNNLTELDNLDENTDLRYRVAPTLASLPSQATKRINGLYLGNVSLQVGLGIIKGTNTSMQYSLDSTNGIDGKWTGAKNNETPLSFVDGNRVWIREGTSQINVRELGIVSSKSKPIINNDNKVEYSISGETISVVGFTGIELQYRIGSGSWKDLATETKEVVFSQGTIEIRTKGDGNSLPSLGVEVGNIAPPVDPPDLKADDGDKTISYLDEQGEWKSIGDGPFQYKVGASVVWKDGSEFYNDGSKHDNVAIYVRKIAGDKVLPSNEKMFTFTKNLNLDDGTITYNIARKELYGTTNKMEYSVNNKDTDNGNWNDAGNTKTKIVPFEGMYLFLREKGKPSIDPVIIINGLKRQELASGALEDIKVDIATEKIVNGSGLNLEYRLVGDSWTPIDGGQILYGIGFVPGNLDFRLRATDNELESHPVTFSPIKAKASPPEVVYDDITNEVSSINGLSSDWSDFEYRIGTGDHWISGELLASEDLSGEKTVLIRIKATADDLPSREAVISFKKNVDLHLVRLSEYARPVTLNGTTKAMYYSINGGDWIQCSEGDTHLKIGNDELMSLDSVYTIELKADASGTVLLYPDDTGTVLP